MKQNTTCLISLKFEKHKTKILERYSNRQNSIELLAKNIIKTFKNTLLVGIKYRKITSFLIRREQILAAINCIGSAEGALVPVLLCIRHWTKSTLPVSPPSLFPPYPYLRKFGNPSISKYLIFFMTVHTYVPSIPLYAKTKKVSTITLETLLILDIHLTMN